MSETPRPDQEETTPEEPVDGGLVHQSRPGDSWEELLAPVEAPSVPGPKSSGATPPVDSRARFLAWTKLLFPALIILGFIAFKAIGALDRRPAILPFGVPQSRPDTITGVKPAEDKQLALDRETRAFLAQLESLAAANDWVRLLEVIRTEQRQPVRGHPVVRGLELVARTRAGERSVELERQLMDSQARLENGDGRFADLLHHTRLARVEQILSRAQNREVLAYNTDLILNLLGDGAATVHEANLRVRVARQFEDVGDQLVTQGDGYIKNDIYLIREARGYYQTALRVLVKSDGWMTLEPLSPRTAPEIDRITEKMRMANRKIHGMGFILSDRDSSTWSGRKNTPIHDDPL